MVLVYSQSVLDSMLAVPFIEFFSTLRLILDVVLDSVTGIQSFLEFPTPPKCGPNNQRRSTTCQVTVPQLKDRYKAHTM